MDKVYGMDQSWTNGQVMRRYGNASHKMKTGDFMQTIQYHVGVWYHIPSVFCLLRLDNLNQ